MIAVINNAVAGVALTLLVRFLSPSAPTWVDVSAGIAGALVLTWLFYLYQRWRFNDYEVRTRQGGQGQPPY
jgi:ABC-type cobalamin transport system permease subunit